MVWTQLSKYVKRDLPSVCTDVTWKTAETHHIIGKDNSLTNKRCLFSYFVDSFYCCSLVEEAKTLGESSSAMRSQMQVLEEQRRNLIKLRGDLEQEITVKRKSLYIDRHRGLRMRTFFPSAQVLAGYVC